MLRAADKRLMIGKPLAGVFGGGPRIFDPVVLSRYDAAVLADSPVGYWKMDARGGAVFDLSGNNRDAVPQLTTLPTYRASAVAGAPSPYALTFAGTDQLMLPVTPTVATDNFSVEAWVRFDDLSGTDYRWIFRCGPSSAARGWGVGILRNGDQMAWVANQNGIGQGGSALTQGTWYHLVWLRDAGTWKSYVNGASNSTNMGNTAPTAAGAGDIAYICGASEGSGSGAVCTIASLAVFNSVLSSGQVTTHYSG